MMDSLQDIRSIDFAEGAILNVDKPIRMTSFGAVSRIRRWTKCKKVGHAGSLDPLATGVLLVCTGKATKRVSELMDFDKWYEGTIELGSTTETDDAEGEVFQNQEVPDFDIEEIETALTGFIGDIMQVPPMFSALKYKGRRLYKLARQGEVVEREPRPVRIHAIEVLAWNCPQLQIRVHCKKGTYIRALARDIGETMGTGGYLASLRRTRIGPYTIEKALSLSRLREALVKDENVQVD